MHIASLKCLFLLVANHLLHGFVFKFFGMLLDLDHFLVLVALALDVMRIVDVLVMLLHLLVLDGLFLLEAHVLVFLGK